MKWFKNRKKSEEEKRRKKSLDGRDRWASLFRTQIHRIGHLKCAFPEKEKEVEDIREEMIRLLGMINSLSSI